MYAALPCFHCAVVLYLSAQQASAYSMPWCVCGRKLVTAKYTRANGYEADCDVIYGDTDSVMVHFRVRCPSLNPAGNNLSRQRSFMPACVDLTSHALVHVVDCHARAAYVRCMLPRANH